MIPVHRYESELSDRALARARRRMQAIPEPEYDEERWPLLFMLPVALVVALFFWGFIALAIVAWS